MKKNKPNKFIRYLKVARAKAKKLNRKKIKAWLNRNLKEHPLILGILFAVWLNYIIRLLFYPLATAELLKSHAKFHSLLILNWLVLVLISNSLKDRQKVKWYLKKRFVFVMLILFPPLGLILLWLGAKFKKKTKIVLTVIFFGLFIVNTVYQGKVEYKILNMSAFDRMTEMITRQKGKIFLKSMDPQVLGRLKLSRLPEKERIKLAVSEIYSRYSSSIVSIKTKDRNGNTLGLGSGFVISRDGLIVTNAHVIKSAYQAEIKINDRVFKEAYLVKNIPNFDIAILKVNASDLTPLYIGNSDGLVGGQFIVAFGNPMGLEHSVSSGIISAVRLSREIKLIQITAPVSPGSSGGPLLNEYGEVVGITTLASFFFAQNLNFAIPINYLDNAISKE